MTHKHEDLKLTAVRYYLDNDTTYAETCRIFNCSERSLKRWIDRFQDEDEIKRFVVHTVNYRKKSFFLSIFSVTLSHQKLIFQ